VCVCEREREREKPCHEGASKQYQGQVGRLICPCHGQGPSSYIPHLTACICIIVCVRERARGKVGGASDCVCQRAGAGD